MIRTCSILLVALAACGESAAPNVDAAGSSDAQTSVDAVTDPVLDLTANFGLTTRSFARAYFGVTASDATAAVEAYVGGDDGCPSKQSATPDATLIVAGIPMNTTNPNGTANLLDFEGVLLGGELAAGASNVGLATLSESADLIAFTTTLTFDGGTVSGTLVATFCASLDGP